MSKSEQAGLATLEEQVGGQPPPDLTARILRAVDQAPPIAEPLPVSRWLLVAALLVTAVGTIYLVHRLTRSDLPQAEAGTPDGVPQGTEGGDIVHPKNKAQVLKWIRSAKSVSIRAVFLHERGSIVRIEPRILAEMDSSASSGVNVPLSDEKTVTRSIVEALESGIQIVPDHEMFKGSQGWSHELDFGLPKGKRMVLRLYGFSRSTVMKAFRVVGLPKLSVPLLAGLGDSMHKVLTAHLEALVEREGLALSIDGLLRLPVDTKRIIAHGLFRHEIPKLTRFGKLAHLDLLHSPGGVNKWSVQTVAELKTLESLVLPANRVTSEILGAIRRLPKLRELFLVGEQIDWLNLRAGPTTSQIDADCAAILATMKGLSELWVVGSAFTDADLEKLATLPKLRTLSLAHNQTFTGKGLAAFRKHKSLRILHLDDCTNLSDEGFAELQEIPRLRRVFLRRVRHVIPGAPGPHNLTGMSLVHLARAKQIEHLVLDNWFSVTMQSPMSDGDNSHLEGDWVQSLADIAKFQTSLRTLSVLQSPDITDADLLKFYGAVHLQKIYFSNMPKVTAKGLARMRSQMPGCKIVLDQSATGR